MKLGIHLSVAGGVDKAVERAVLLGCNTFQIFVSNPRGWKPSIISEEEAKIFRENYNEAEIKGAVAHSIYLINLASGNTALREQSIDSLISGLENTEKLGLAGLVTHIGSHGGDGLETGIERVVDALGTILENTTGSVPLLLENTAGAGNLVGDKIEEIGEIIRKIKSDRVGFCLDTAHAFESGYEIQTEAGLEDLITLIEREIGLDKLIAIHLNDSMTEQGSKRDRHENFGEGFIGKEAMIRIINHPKLKDKSFVMETPGEMTKEMMGKIRNLGQNE